MAKQSTIRLILICSGETNWDECARLSGSCDHPLSDEGRQRVEALLKDQDPPLKFGLILSAEDEASRQTAEIAAKLGGGRVKLLEDLAEMNLGLWEGLLSADLEEKYPTVYRQWIEDPGGVNVPDGENLLEAEERVFGTLIRLLLKAKDEDEPVGIVLRPIAFGLVEAWLSGGEPHEIWSILRDRTRVTRHSVQRSVLKDWRARSRAGL
jgi:broad specificity phosphatase PhoE